MSGCRLPWVSLLTDLMNEWSWFFLLFSGRNTMKATGLMLMPEGFCTDYNPAVNPAILNEFASAAFRWHTLVQVQLLCNCFSWNLSFVKLFFFQGFYQLMSENGQVRENYQMRKIFNNPSLLYRDGAIDEATYGLVAAKSEAFDPIFIDDVWWQTMSSFFTTGFLFFWQIKNFLFPAGQNATFGMDLVSINIQRGRDHGMPPYNVVRRACGLPPVRDFRQLNSILQRGSAARFAEIYE